MASRNDIRVHVTTRLGREDDKALRNTLKYFNKRISFINKTNTYW